MILGCLFVYSFVTQCSLAAISGHNRFTMKNRIKTISKYITYFDKSILVTRDRTLIMSKISSFAVGFFDIFE